MILQYDVIIIGSGPAGCAAAISCRQHRLRVLMVAGKKQRYETESIDPQPSESIHPGVAVILDKLNAAHCIEAASQGVYEGIEVNGQYNVLGEDAAGMWRGHHINRIVFDEALLQCAAQQGITIMKNDTVANLIIKEYRVAGVITKTGVQINGCYVIDASGQKRLAGRKLRFNESFYSPPLVVWTGVSGNIPTNSCLPKQGKNRFIPRANGWVWLAPDLPGRCTWTMLSVKGKQQFLPPAELPAFASITPVKAINRRWRVFRPVCREGVLLCGDAAGIIDPAAGQGILNALVSAIKAAQTVAACIKNADFESLYLARYDDWFINDYLNKVNRLKDFYKQHGITLTKSV